MSIRMAGRNQNSVGLAPGELEPHRKSALKLALRGVMVVYAGTMRCIQVAWHENLRESLRNDIQHSPPRVLDLPIDLHESEKAHSFDLSTCPPFNIPLCRICNIKHSTFRPAMKT